MRLIKDVILFTTKEMPKWNPINVCSYHLQEAGATPVQELAFALATAIARARHGERPRAKYRRTSSVTLSDAISFFVNAGLRFVTELCKMRAFTELWDEITASATGSPNAKQRLFRYGVQVNSLGLTEPQPENNVARILIEMLAVTLSKNARARAPCSCRPGTRRSACRVPWDQQWSLRMQQIRLRRDRPARLRRYFRRIPGEIARKVDDLKRQAREELTRIEADGRRGRRRRHRLPEAAAGQSRIRRGSRRSSAVTRLLSGVNKYLEANPRRWPVPPTLFSLYRTTRGRNRASIGSSAWRASRDQRGGSRGA